jgi:two-component system, NtrC family, sensor kinase
VASQWRIRHKLMLGLVLVVGIMALLLGGTLRGLWSYYGTVNNIRFKLAEQQQAEKLKEVIAHLASVVKAVKPLDTGAIKDAVIEVRSQLNTYQDQLDETVRQGYCDTVKTEHVQGLIGKLIELLDNVDNAADKISQPQSVPNGGDGELRNAKLKETQDHVEKMESIGGDLSASIYDELKINIGDSRRHYQITLWVILPASVVGLVLVCGLMRACYAWVVYPMRDLENGVIRVAQGDFEHRIQVDSGDEMQDLAEAFNDMTQRLQALYNDLARQVNERSRQLVRSEKLASVGFLAAGVAHEINNPLASIAFCSEALEARLTSLMRLMPTSILKGDDLEVFTRYLKMIQQEAFRCKTITEKLLDFSRTGEKRREPTDLEQLIQSVLDITQHLQNSKGKQIAFESQTERVPGGRIMAAVNAEEIKSVVLNLVVNALDSMDDGGQLTIRLCQRDGMAQMQFTDTGCGMSQEVLENIFEPFFTRSRTGKGTGLGLTISHRIINHHGGEIEAASAGPNQGSTFTVRLPVQMVESNVPLESRGTARSLAA